MLNRRRFLTTFATGAAAMAARRRLSALPFAALSDGAAGSGLAADQDQDRPEFHLLAPHNWLNDPNGPIWWKGQYHLFYQMNPGAAVWGDMHWGHAVSTDLIHWSHRPIALAPTPGGPDSAGCFTGSAVVYKGVPTLLYTGVVPIRPADAATRDSGNSYRETQLLATAADDSLEHWNKVAAPVIAEPPAGMQVTGFRDPCPWREADGWYMIIGSGLRGRGGMALLYRSQDLRTWEYLHPLAEGKGNGKHSDDANQTGEMWECPDFFEVNGRSCLLHSSEGRVYWNTGEYDKKEHRFHIARTGLVDQGACYAPKSFAAPDGRRILWGWIQETRPEAEFARAGWAGAVTLPRVLSIGAQGQLEVSVAREFESLRGAAESARVRLGSAYKKKLATLRAELELPIRFGAGAVTVRLRQAGQTKWELTVDPGAGQVRVVDPAHPGEKSFPLAGLPWPRPGLHLFLDGSVIESFVGGREALTSRVYGLKAGEAELEVEVAGKGELNLSFWPLAAISSDRLTS